MYTSAVGMATRQIPQYFAQLPQVVHWLSAKDVTRTARLWLAAAIESTFPDSWVELEVPVHAIPTGEDWKLLRDQLRARCLEAVGSMALASYHDLTRTRVDWPGEIPFPVRISRQPGKRAQVHHLSPAASRLARPARGRCETRAR